jgi:hypothetical protein
MHNIGRLMRFSPYRVEILGIEAGEGGCREGDRYNYLSSLPRFRLPSGGEVHSFSKNVPCFHGVAQSHHRKVAEPDNLLFLRIAKYVRRWVRGVAPSDL